MQDKRSAHVRLIPCSAPTFAIVVTLPVPILYPIKNKPGPTADKDIIILRVIFIFCNSKISR